MTLNHHPIRSGHREDVSAAAVALAGWARNVAQTGPFARPGQATIPPKGANQGQER